MPGFGELIRIEYCLEGIFEQVYYCLDRVCYYYFVGMIQEDQKILLVTEGRLLYQQPKHNNNLPTTNAFIFTHKKIVITTQRLLLYQSLNNRLAQTEYQLTTSYAKKHNKHDYNKFRISVNSFPQFTIELKHLQVRIIREEDPLINAWLLKMGIASIIKTLIGHLLLTNSQKKRFYVVGLQEVRSCYWLGKAIVCGQMWKRYEGICREQNIQINYDWIKIVHEMINQQQPVVLIDPDLFISGSKEEIRSFVYLIALIPFAHHFHHQYAISTVESAEYTRSLLEMFAHKAYSVSFARTSITTDNIKLIFNKIKFANLMKLDLSQNNLQDEVFETLHKLLKSEARKLQFINLSHNKIRFMNPQLFVQLLKLANSILSLSLAHNQIDDSIIETIQKYVIFAFNPPLEELNLSYNLFTRKVIWRLYVGNVKNFNVHPYLRFIVQPIPIKRQIFQESDIDFPQSSIQLSQNMHSKILQPIDYQRILKHQFEMEPQFKNVYTIRLKRSNNHNKLPSNRQELNKTLQLSHKLENFIYQNYSVQKIYGMTLQVKKFALQIPPISKLHFTKFISEKLNEALFVRDHYSIRYLFKCTSQLNIPVDGFKERLLLVQKRDEIYIKRYENLMNFDIDQNHINNELDELVRQGLRLNLEGNGVELLYYLKYKRDQYIEKYLYDKFNPEHHLFNLMAKESISTDQAISEKQFVIPYEIRLQKKINENFYLHPWQANYQALCEMKAVDFQSCFQFLQVNDRKDKFAIFFQRIEDRIEFIKNEFNYLVYNKFKASYSDLKINCCRLIYLYNNFKHTSVYSETPFFIRKKPLSQEKTISVTNEEWFKREHHISTYPNVNEQARQGNIYSFNGLITKYQTQRFLKQGKVLLEKLSLLFWELERGVISNMGIQKMIGNFMEYFIKILDVVRNSTCYEELKEEFYLHIITYKQQNNHIRPLLLYFLPVFTMYLKPPLTLERYLVSWVIAHEKIDLSQYPICIASNFNYSIQENALNMENNFVQRQWMPGQKMFLELFQKKGAVTLQIKHLQDKKMSITIAESKTVGDLMEEIIVRGQILLQDREHFWLYRYDKQSQEYITFEGREHIGEVVIADQEKVMQIMLKRRIYSRQLKYNYQRYGFSMINNLYYDIKFEYLVKNFFNNDTHIAEVTAILFLIEEIEKYHRQQHPSHNHPPKHKSTAKQAITLQKALGDRVNAIEATIYSYIPRKIYNRVLKSKQIFLEALKGKINERMQRKEYNNVQDLKLQLIQIFRHYPEFMSSNYTVLSMEKAEIKLSINVMHIYFVYEDYRDKYTVIQLQKIVSIVPKAKYLLITYHKHENIVEDMHIFTEQKVIFAIAMDIFTYCSLRMKMSSINLYEIHHLEGLQAKILELQQYKKKQYDKNIEKVLIRSKEEKEISLRKISKISLSLMKLHQIQYYSRNRYIKSEVSRKLYHNKTDRREAQKEANENRQPVEDGYSIHKINDLLFPIVNLQEKNPFEESFLKEYEQMYSEQYQDKEKDQQQPTALKNKKETILSNNPLETDKSQPRRKPNTNLPVNQEVKVESLKQEMKQQKEQQGVVRGKRTNRTVNRRKNR